MDKRQVEIQSQIRRKRSMRYERYLREEETATLGKDLKIKGSDTVIPKGTTIKIINSKEDAIVGEVTIKGQTIRITVSKDDLEGDGEEKEEKEEE